MEKLSYDHGTSPEPLLGTTLGRHFDLVAERRAYAEALVDCPDGVRLTYADLKHQVDKFARGLLRLGVGPGDRVGVWSRNNRQWVICQLATARVGAILVNINPAYRTGELEYALNQSGVKVLVAARGYRADEYLEMVRQLAPELFQADSAGAKRLPALERLVLIADCSEDAPGVTTFDAVCELGTTVDPCELAGLEAGLQFDDPINIQYTSGTTGFPKGVTLSHHNLLNNALYAGEAMALDGRSRFCVPMPFYHCGGMVLCTLATLCRGGTLVIPSPSFDARAVLAAVESEGCTHLSGVPTMYIEELEQPDFSKFDLSGLKGGFMAGAPCPVELMRRVSEQMHLKEIVIFYGLTECSPVITSTTTRDSLEVRASTVGRAIPHMELKIVDPVSGKVVPRGTQGEILARGYAVMLGYWNNPEATHEAIDAAGWLHTGDLGVMSESACIHITGRKKDMVIRGGENIYPREIEELLIQHPAVSQAYAFGVPDYHLGEELAVWVKLKPDAAASSEDIQNWLRERVAHFKVPRYVKFVADFPMTVTGKVQKFMMRRTMIEELGLNAEAAIQTA